MPAQIGRATRPRPYIKDHMTEKRLPSTGLPVGGVSAAALVCGDPARATMIAEQLTDVVKLSDQREYRAYRGMFGKTAVTVCSHGIGAAGAAIAFEELIGAGAKRIIRVGTCGGIQPEINTGDLVVATAAVDRTGYGRLSVPESYPAVADGALTEKLKSAMGDQPFAQGIVLTSDSFYPGVTTSLTPDYKQLAEANVQAVEMECAALFLLGSLRGVQTAAILAVDGNVLHARESMDSYAPHEDVVKTAVSQAINAALTAIENG